MTKITTKNNIKLYKGDLPFLFEPKRSVQVGGYIMPLHCFNYFDTTLDNIIQGKIIMYEGLSLFDEYERELTFYINPDNEAPRVGIVRVNVLDEPRLGNKLKTERWNVPDEAEIGKFLTSGFMVRMSANGDIIDSGRPVASFTVAGQSHLRDDLTPFNGFLERPPSDIENNRIIIVKTMIDEFISMMEMKKRCV